MMIPSLARFDRYTAAGILARAAMALDDEDNPAAAPKLDGESSIRAAVLADARRILGISPDDHTPQTLEQVGDALDAERDALIGSSDNEVALKRLAEKGELPSDLFEIRVIPNIQDFFGKKYSREKELIEETIRAPEKEQHYGAPEKPDDPFLISLFAKTIPDQFPYRTFTMLVVGQRRGLVLDVHQAWRIYPSSVNLEGAKDLVEILRRFADAFGAEIQIGDKKGKFILAADLPKGQPVKMSFSVEPEKLASRPSKTREITISCFTQQNPLGETTQAALAVGVDLDRYRKVLKSYGW